MELNFHCKHKTCNTVVLWYYHLYYQYRWVTHIWVKELLLGSCNFQVEGYFLAMLTYQIVCNNSILCSISKQELHPLHHVCSLLWNDLIKHTFALIHGSRHRIFVKFLQIFVDTCQTELVFSMLIYIVYILLSIGNRFELLLPAGNGKNVQRSDFLIIYISTSITYAYTKVFFIICISQLAANIVICTKEI
jgi:hypothetical protein